jgi:hypothetical protein
VNPVLDEETVASAQAGEVCALENYLALPDRSMDDRIAQTRARLGATTVILGHHYQRDEVIRFADYTGDSYKLSKIAAETGARNVVFCGVHFMAESADILGRDGQQAILPDLNAGCSMADMAEISQVEDCWETLERFGLAGETVPLTYINSTAAIKAFCGENGGRARPWSGPSPAASAFSFCPISILAATPALPWGFRWTRWWFGTLGACRAGKPKPISPQPAWSCGRATAPCISAFCPAMWTRCAQSIREFR